MGVLQEEANLNEIVQLVGKDSLSAGDQITLETAKMIREDFLQQNSFVDIDSYSEYDRQARMLALIRGYDSRWRSSSPFRPVRRSAGPSRCPRTSTGRPTPPWTGRWRMSLRPPPRRERVRYDPGI